MPREGIWATFAIIAVAAWSYALEKASLEVTSVTVMVALLLFFHFFPVTATDGGNRLGADALLAGFANPALITVMALLVIGQGLFQTGALEGPTQRIAARGISFPGTTLALVLLLAGVTSAFMNNTPVVVMFIPVISALTARLGLNISKTIMPLSFISILGGMVTLIGSSTNLLVAGVAGRLGVGPIGFFDFVAPGLLLASIGAVYVLFVAPRLLRVRETMAEAVGARSGKQFIAQIPIAHDHPLEGQTAVAGLFPALKDMTVRMIQRGEHPILPPFRGRDPAQRRHGHRRRDPRRPHRGAEIARRRIVHRSRPARGRTRGEGRVRNRRGEGHRQETRRADAGRSRHRPRLAHDRPPDRADRPARRHRLHRARHPAPQPHDPHAHERDPP
jgi:hypothetical protein